MERESQEGFRDDRRPLTAVMREWAGGEKNGTATEWMRSKEEQ